MTKQEIEEIVNGKVQAEMTKIRKRRILSLILGITLVPLAVWATSITKPHTFTSGTPAVAAEVNENFDTLFTAINHLDLTNWSTSSAGTVAYKGEIRTIDSTSNSRLWGQGRPNAVRYGTTGIEAGLCTNGSIKFGLSKGIVDWAGVSAQCPAGTWVCTELERGTAACDTARPDTTTDAVDCSASPGDQNLPANNHVGFVADTESTNLYYVRNVSESGSGSGGRPCEQKPVWCCSN